MYILQQLTNFYATDNIMSVVFISVVCALVIGHLLDKTLGGFSFGLFGNALLVLMSMIVGVSVGPEHATFMNSNGSVRMAVLSSAVATGLLLGLGALKSYLINFKS